MAVKMYVMDEEYRMKVVNFLKIYGYYDGILGKNDISKKYVNGDLKVSDIIRNKKDYKELKMSISAAINYCYENNFDEISNIMNHFYKVECLDVRRKYGSFFDRL